MKLIATKSYRYDTRRLVAGDEFEATDMHARVLVGARKARYAHETGPQHPPQPSPPSQPKPPPPESEPDDDEPDERTPSRPGGDDIEPLRAKARALGIAVDGRWGVARLQYEIGQVRR